MPIKISQLPTASLVTSDDFFPIVDSGSLTTQRTTAQQVLNFVTGSTFNTLSVALLTGTTITGSAALFTSVTASHAGSGAGLTNIPNSATTATSANTANAIVARDASGNFSAGTITAALSGNATTVTNGVYTTTISSHATTGVTAGNGLTGGGTVGTLTLNVGAGDGISVAADTVAVDSTVLRTTTAQSISGPKTFTDYITGSITGSDARFTSVTASHAGSGAGLTNIPNAGLVNSSVTIGSTSISLGSSSTIIAGLTQVTSSEIFVSGDLKVNGTASITQLNTLNQTSLVVGDKYITILSGGVDHTGINGAGILWGTSSGPGETTGALGEHAHILYDASRDALKIFPGLYVSGTTTVDGNVGIGTSSPNYKLDVNGEIAIRGSVSANDDRIYFQAEDNSNRFTIKTDLDSITQNDLLIFRSNFADNMLTLKGDAKVGIGTNSPQYNLTVGDPTTGLNVDHIADSPNAVALRFGDASGWKFHIARARETGGGAFNTGTTGALVTFQDNGNVGIGTNSPQVKTEIVKGSQITSRSAANTVLFVSDNSTSQTYLEIANTTSGEAGLLFGKGSSTGNYGVVKYINSVDQMQFYTAAGQRMVIDSVGNVGIGTTSPVTKLDVNGIISIDGVPVINLNSNKNDIYANLRVLYNNSSVNQDGMYINFNSTGGAGADIRFYASGTTERMRIVASNGNVGIGTANPVAKLDVSGSIRVTGGSIYGQVAEITASVSTTYTLQSSDSGKFLTINNGSPVTLTVPSGLPTGFTVSVCQLGAGQITVSPSGVTINNRQSHTKAAGQHAVISIVGTAADTYVLVGDTAL